MAQTISIPIRFEHRTQRVKWAVGKIRLLSWKSGYGLWWLKAAVSEPEELANIAFARPIFPDDIPESAREKLPPVGESLSHDVQATPIEALLCLSSIGREPTYAKFDPWILRREFLSLKRSTADLLEFLNGYGAWSLEAGPQQLRSYRHESVGKWTAHPVFEREIWADQDRIRESLKLGAGEWFSGSHSSLILGSRPEFPHYMHSDVTCLEGIHTSITVDFLRGVKFRVCARADCGNPFPDDRKGKQYCEQYCAHLVSVRKGRRAKRRQTKG